MIRKSSPFCRNRNIDCLIQDSHDKLPGDKLKDIQNIYVNKSSQYLKNLQDNLLNQISQLQKKLSSLSAIVSSFLRKSQIEISFDCQENRQVNLLYELIYENKNLNTLQCNEVSLLMGVLQKCQKLETNAKVSQYLIEEKVAKLGEKIGNHLNENLKGLNRLLNSFGEQTPSGNEQLNCCTKELRPTRVLNPQQQVNRQVNKKASKLKISDLKSVKKGQKFDITIKVIKIIKFYKVKGVQNIWFIGADETGEVQCVFPSSKKDTIVVEKVLNIFNCKVYDFKSTRQIQDTPFTTIQTVGQQIIQKTAFNQLVCKQKTVFLKQKDAIKPKQTQNFQVPVIPVKIQQIHPDSQNICVQASVYSIYQQSQNKINLVCRLGDETGIVTATVCAENNIKEGKVYIFTGLDSRIFNSQLVMVQRIGGKAIPNDIKIQQIMLDNDISEVDWEEGQQQQN